MCQQKLSRINIRHEKILTYRKRHDDLSRINISDEKILDKEKCHENNVNIETRHEKNVNKERSVTTGRGTKYRPDASLRWFAS